MKKKCLSGWAKGVFTVEAAVIIPLSVSIIALLLGYCFLVHQTGWLRGAAYESALKSTEKGITAEQDGAAEKRMKQRLREIPLYTGEIKMDITGEQRIRMSWQGRILESVFGDRFDYSGNVTLTDFDPVRIKRLEYLLRSFGKKEE